MIASELDLDLIHVPPIDEELLKRLREGFADPAPGEQIAAAVELRKLMARGYDDERLAWLVRHLRERYAEASGQPIDATSTKPLLIDAAAFATQDGGEADQHDETETTPNQTSAGPAVASKVEMLAEANSLLEELKLRYTLSSEREMLTAELRSNALRLLVMLFIALAFSRVISPIFTGLSWMFHTSPSVYGLDALSTISNLTVIAVVGAAGAMVSILRRTEPAMDIASTNADPVRQVAGLRHGDTAVLISGFVGAAVSFVLLALFASGLMGEEALAGKMVAVLFPTIDPCPDPDAVCTFTMLDRGLNFARQADAAKMLIWAFIGGFSEQLVPDVLDRLTKAAKASNAA
ncbi:hypothetical protein [Caulobacter sp.]|uniref:hypothetical protein n=1 Tax=Caulobacter sp. TaxID=78 RepID=UPI003BB21270